MSPAHYQPLGERVNECVAGTEKMKVLTTANAGLEERKKEATPPLVERGVGSSPVPPVKRKSPKRERRTLRSRAGNVKRERTEESKEEGEGSRTPEAVEKNPANGTKPKRPAKRVAEVDGGEGPGEMGEGSDEEDEVYEAEYIAAVRESEEGRRFLIKWRGWPHNTSTWERETMFENMKECVGEFAERNRLLSVVIRNPKERSMPAREVQLQSLMKWEDDMNEVLKQAGRQKILVYNDVDEVMARTNFQYIISNKYPEELVAFWKGIGSSCACSCKDECTAGTKCCPSEEDSTQYYTKRGCLKKAYVDDSAAQGASRILVECNAQCSCGPSCPTRVVQKGRTARVVLVRTEGCGWGVVALEDIQANAFVVEYVGEVLTAKDAIARKDSMYQYDLDSNGTVEYVIDAKYYGNEAAFINHSCEPNLRSYCIHIERVDPSLHHIGIFSTRRIKKGEHLTLDYFQHQDERKHTGRKCMCGAASCMKFWPTSKRSG